jgi:hypothetical protein
MPADLIALGLMAASLVPAEPAPVAGPALGAVPSRSDAPGAAPRFRIQADVSEPALALGRGRTPGVRQLASLVDYYPIEETGLRLSAGLRAPGKRRGLATAPRRDAAIYVPPTIAAMPYRTDTKRRQAAVTVGWTMPIADGAVVGVEAGTRIERGDGRPTGASIAQPARAAGSWTRLNPVAQIGFAWAL